MIRAGLLATCLAAFVLAGCTTPGETACLTEDEVRARRLIAVRLPLEHALGAWFVDTAGATRDAYRVSAPPS
jgi:hypothetical protein